MEPIDDRINKKIILGDQRHIDKRAQEIFKRTIHGFTSCKLFPPVKRIAQDDSFLPQGRKVALGNAIYEAVPDVVWNDDREENMHDGCMMKVGITDDHYNPEFYIYFRERLLGAGFDPLEFETQLHWAMSMLIRGFCWHLKQGEVLPPITSYLQKP